MKGIQYYLLLWLKGFCMGLADLIPGISGGTIALITGVYTTLLNAMQAFDKKMLQLLLLRKWKQCWQHINGNFLLVLSLGIATSVLTLVPFILYLLNNYFIQLNAFFIGLIVISAWNIFRTVSKNYLIVCITIACIFIAYLLTNITPIESPTSHWFIILSGVLAIFAMILPGISGSFILLLLGKYTFIMQALKMLQWNILSMFVLGCLLGIIGFSSFINWLLKYHYDVTIASLTGLMIGALNKIWPWKYIEYIKNAQNITIEKNILPIHFQTITGKEPYILQAILLCCTGMLFFIFLEKIAQKLTINKT